MRACYLILLICLRAAAWVWFCQGLVAFEQPNGVTGTPLLMSLCEMAKEAALSFRIPVDMKDALERAAKADDRSVSSLVERIVRQWLVEKGFLAQET